MQLKRRISTIGLVLLGINGCLGSGWLFAPLFSAKLAGPSSLIAWVIGAAMMLLIMMTFIESVVLYPIPGASSRLPLLTHGKLTGFIMSWIAWLATVVIPPIEVQTALQYSATYFPSLTHTTEGITTLTYIGFIWAALLLFLLSFINAANFRNFSLTNSLLFVVKTGIIILVIVALLGQEFHPANFAGLAPNLDPSTWHGIFAAIASGGIIFALSAKHTVDLVGEARNPERSIPMALISTVLICGLMYLGLQIAFMGVLDPILIAHGWSNLSFQNEVGPLLGLIILLGITWLVPLLYFDAVASPLGCGLVYVAAAARIIYGMSQAGFLSKMLAKLNNKQMPFAAIMLNFVIGMFMFLPLPGWQAMTTFFASIVVVSFAIGPIVLLSLRYQQPNMHRPFKLWSARTLCFIAFYSCNLAVYWAGWNIVSKLIIAVGAGIVVFLLAYYRGKVSTKHVGLQSLTWLIPYFASMGVVSYLGSYNGLGYIPFGWDFLVIAIASLGLLYLAVRARLAESDLEAIADTDIEAILQQRQQQKEKISVNAMAPPAIY